MYIESNIHPIRHLRRNGMFGIFPTDRTVDNGIKPTNEDFQPFKCELEVIGTKISHFLSGLRHFMTYLHSSHKIAL